MDYCGVILIFIVICGSLLAFAASSESDRK